MPAPTNSPIAKPTGLTSTSFRVWLVTFITGLAGALQSILTNGTTAHQAIFGLGGGAVALFSTLGKLFHDNGLNRASLANAGSDIAAALPALRLDLSKSVSFIENDLPAVQTAISDLQAKVAGVGPDAAAIEGIVRSVLTEILAKNTTPPA